MKKKDSWMYGFFTSSVVKTNFSSEELVFKKQGPVLTKILLLIFLNKRNIIKIDAHIQDLCVNNTKTYIHTGRNDNLLLFLCRLKSVRNKQGKRITMVTQFQ